MNRMIILVILLAAAVAVYHRDQIQEILQGKEESKEAEECVPTPIPSEDELYRFAQAKLTRSA